MADAASKITAYKDETGQFSVRSVEDETGTWYVAQDIAKSAGWAGQVGKPSPTRELPSRCKKVFQIVDRVAQAGNPFTYEVLCLNDQGVWLFIDAIKKALYRPITGEFMAWFEREVLNKIKKEQEQEP